MEGLWGAQEISSTHTRFQDGNMTNDKASCRISGTESDKFKGIVFSSVDPILMFLGQTVLVCQSYNGRYRSLSL